MTGVQTCALPICFPVTIAGGATIATDEVNGVQHELVKVEFGVDGVATMVSASDPLPVTGTVEVKFQHLWGDLLSI